jgi:hypothetical protein
LQDESRKGVQILLFLLLLHLHFLVELHVCGLIFWMSFEQVLVMDVKAGIAASTVL